MTNAELIDKLRILQGAILNPHHRGGEYVDKRFADVCVAAADALEADEKRIINLLTALCLANEKLAYVDCQPYTEIDGEEMISDWVKTLVYEELYAQLPEEGEWIVTTEVSDDGAVASHINCSRCGFYWREPKHGKVFKRCPNCGAKMRTVTDCHTLNER